MKDESKVVRLTVLSLLLSLLVSIQVIQPLQALADPASTHSICFDGSDSAYFNYPAGQTIGTSDFTLEFWIKPTLYSNYMTFIDTGYGDGTNKGRYLGYNWDLNKGSGVNNGPTPVNYRIKFYDGLGGSGIDSTLPVPLNTWKHVVAMRKNNLFTTYINGVQDDSSQPLTLNFEKSGIYLGSGYEKNGSFVGCMTSVRLVTSAIYSTNFTIGTVGTLPTLPTLPNGAINLISMTVGSNSITNSGTAGALQIKTGTLVYENLPRLPQNISFTSPGDKTMGTAPFSLVGTSTSGLSVAFTSVTTSTCTVSGTTLTLVAAGSCTINADQAGDDTYDPATQVPRTFTITLISQATITINAASGTYGSTTTLGTSGGSGGGVVSYTVVSGKCTVASDVLSNTSAGSCVVTATKAADATYLATTSAQVTVVIAKQSLIFPYTIVSSTGEFKYGATYTVSMTFPADAIAGNNGWNVFKASTAFAINSGGDPVCIGAAVTAVGAYTCSFNSAGMYPTSQAIAISGLHVRFEGSTNYNSFNESSVGTKIAITGCEYVFCANSGAVTVTATNKTINFSSDAGSLTHTISNGANGATTAWGVGCTTTYTTGAAVGTYPITCTSTSRPLGAPNSVTNEWVAANTSYTALYNANVDNELYTLKNPVDAGCGSAAQWWVRCSFYTSDTYSNLTFVNGVLTVQKATLATPAVPSAVAVAGSPNKVSVTYSQIANAVSHTAKVYATNGTSLLQTILNFTSGTTISGLSANTNYKISIIAVGDGTNTGTSNESSQVSITTNIKSTSRTIVFPTTSYSLNYVETQTVSADVSARANIPTITFDGINLTNTNPRLTLGINGNKGANGNFFGYALEQGSFTEGQIVTMTDLRAGSTVTYSGKLHFLYAGGFGWAFFITEILSVTGSSVNTTSSNWLLTGEGAITYSAGVSTACSVDRWTGIVSITSGTGSCSISATVVEDSIYQEATTSTPITITVNKVPQSPLSLSLSASTKGSPYSQALTLIPSGGSGGGATTYEIVAGGTATGCALANASTTNTLTATSAGTCLIQAVKASDSNYSATTSAAQTFTFTSSDQTGDLAVSSLNGTYGTDLNLTSTGGSGNGGLTYTTSTVGCSLPTSTTLRANHAITCQVIVTKAADANYNSATSLVANIVFATKTLTITGLTGVNKEFDGAVSSSVSGATTLSGIIVGDEVSLLGTPTFAFATPSAGNSKTVTGSGYSLTGNDSTKYSLAQPEVTANITKKSATVTATSSAVAVGSAYSPAFTSSGLVGSDSITSVTYNFSATGTGSPPLIAGSSIITPSAAVFIVGTGDNYTITYVTGTLDIVTSFQVSFKSNFTNSDTSTTTVNFTPGDNALTLPTPTRANYTFTGWYTLQTNGVQVTGAYTPTAAATLWARWIQNSLYGIGASTKILTITTLTGVGNSYSANASGGTIAIEYLADALPAGTVIDAYVLSDTSTATALIGAGNNYVMSLVLAWVHPTTGLVETTASGKPITMTITNGVIKKGAKIYSVVGVTPTLLTTATADGIAVISITDDPQIIIAITKPDAPTGVSATNGGSSSSTVTWIAPSDGGSSIISYTVTSNASHTCTTSTTSCTVTGLSDATSYTFTVTVTNAIGTSDASVPSVAIITEDTAALVLAAQQAAAALAAQQAAAALAAQQAAAALAAQQAAAALAAQQAAAALAAQQAAVAEAARVAELARIAEAARVAELARIAEAARLAEIARLAEAARVAELARIAEEQRLAELARIAEEQRLAELARIAEEQRLAELARIAEEQRLAALKAIEDAKIAEQARLLAVLEAIEKEQAALLQARINAAAQADAEKKVLEEKALAEKIAEQAKAAAELKAQQEAQAKAIAEAKAAEQARLAAEAELIAVAEKKAVEDAAIAAALAAKQIVPKITLYSISSNLTLSAYDNAYLKKYISTLKNKAQVTCIGYYYAKNMTITTAKALATAQAKAVCAMIKKAKPSVITTTVLYPSTKAPLAAKGAKWVAVSYRVDGFKS